VSLRELIGSRYVSEEKKYNKAGEWKMTTYIITCPIDGCSNTCRVEKHKHLAVRKCKQHALFDNLDRSKWTKSIKQIPCIECGVRLVVEKGSSCQKCISVFKKKRPYERTFNRATKSAPRIRADKTEIKWSLTYEDFASLCSIPNCHYCDKPLNRAKYKADSGSTSMLLDRKDSEQDYTINNCVPCCSICNDTKGRYISYDEMMLIMQHRKLNNFST
jgi:hypothetical protein